MPSGITAGSPVFGLQGILEEGGRGETPQAAGAATAPVRLVHGVGASAGRAANPVGKAVRYPVPYRTYRACFYQSAGEPLSMRVSAFFGCDLKVTGM